MSQGIEIRDASGNLTYSTADVTWNQVDYFSVTPGIPYILKYTVLDGKEFLAFQIFIDPPPLDRRAIAWSITQSGSDITVSGGTEAAYILLLMR